MKRGQISIQFNWIFVLIVGSAILATIIAFTFNVEETSNRRITIQLAQQYETIFTSTLQQPGTGKEYRSPPLDLRFVCNYEQDVYHYEVDGIVARETPYDLISSAEDISTTRLRTFALEWNVPYPVDTFLYLTIPQEEVVFYSPTSNIPTVNIKRLLDVFPSNFTHRVVYGSYTPNIAAANNDRVIVVQTVGGFELADNTLLSPDALDGVENVHVVIINSDEGFFRSGQVLLLDGDEYSDYVDGMLGPGELNDRTERYIGEAALFAAIFADSQENYRCVMSKAYTRLHMVTQILLQQLTVMEDDTNDDCEVFLLGNEVFTSTNHVQFYLDQIATASEGGYSAESMESIASYTDAIASLHQRITLQQSCPLLY